MKATDGNRQRYRIVLADDQEEVRGALRRFLEKDGRFEIVAEVETGVDAIATVNSAHPDALILDLAMPDIDGLQALTQIMEEAPGTKVVVLSSMVPFNETGPKVLSLGAVAAFDKFTSPKKVIKALVKALKEGSPPVENG